MVTLGYGHLCTVMLTNSRLSPCSNLSRNYLRPVLPGWEHPTLNDFFGRVLWGNVVPCPVAYYEARAYSR